MNDTFDLNPQFCYAFTLCLAIAGRIRHNCNCDYYKAILPALELLPLDWSCGRQRDRDYVVGVILFVAVWLTAMKV